MKAVCLSEYIHRPDRFTICPPNSPGRVMLLFPPVVKAH